MFHESKSLIYVIAMTTPLLHVGGRLAGQVRSREGAGKGQARMGVGMRSATISSLVNAPGVEIAHAPQVCQLLTAPG